MIYSKGFDEITNYWNVYKFVNNMPEFMYAFYSEDLADLFIFCLERSIQ